jgi:hypothetical protein
VPVSVPFREKPEVSLAIVPEPSSKRYWPVRVAWARWDESAAKLVKATAIVAERIRDDIFARGISVDSVDEDS